MNPYEWPSNQTRPTFEAQLTCLGPLPPTSLSLGLSLVFLSSLIQKTLGEEAHFTERQQGLEWVQKATDQILVLPKTCDYLAQVYLWTLLSHLCQAQSRQFHAPPFPTFPPFVSTLINISGYSRVTTGITRPGKTRWVTRGILQSSQWAFGWEIHLLLGKLNAN